MNQKKKTFKQDEFVNYVLFPDSESLRVKKRSVILEVLSDGSYYDYEIFIDGGFTDNSNAQNLAMDRRNFETDINMEVLGYLMGEGPNREKPKIIKRQNTVEVKLPREHVIMGDIPDNIKDGKYRE